MRRTLEPEVMDTAEDAEEYEAMDFSEPDSRFAEAALALLGEPSERDRLLSGVDIGTGTAKIPILLLERRLDLSLLAVDMSDQMLRVALRKAERAPFGDRLKIAKMDAKALDLKASSMDLVMSNSLAHHLPEPLALLREIARVASRTGAVLVRDLLRPDSTDDAWAIVNRVSPNDSSRQKQLFFDSLCAALTLSEVREIADCAGLHDAAVEQVSDRHWSLERPRRA